MTTCGDKHYFPRDRFAGVNPAHAVCQKPPHSEEEAHEFVRGSMLYTWRNRDGRDATG